MAPIPSPSARPPRPPRPGRWPSASTGVNAIAIGNAATATGSVAIGNGASASNGGAAFGDGAVATGAAATAVGPNSHVTFANSAAFGSGAQATRANQQVFGTATNSYTMSGITSAASKGAQAGALQIVTSDAGGNLATNTIAGLGLATQNDIQGINSQLAGINGRLDNLDAKSKTAFTGVAMAMAMAGVPTVLPNETVAFSGNWGSFQGSNGLSLGAALRLTENVQLNSGVAYGLRENIVSGRVGVRVGW